MPVQTGARGVDYAVESIFRTPERLPNNVEFHFETALDVFDHLLADVATKWELLPYLSLVTTVLATHAHRSELSDFLYKCCSKLEGTPNTGFPISVYYSYMLSHQRHDDIMIAHHGVSLQSATEITIRNVGTQHPASVTARNFRNWHRIYVQNPSRTDLRSELLDCVFRAEQIAGPENLLALNSLAILGRFLQEQGLYHEAKVTLQTVSERIDSESNLLQPYKCEIEQRLALVL